MTKKILIIHPNADFYAQGLADACPQAEIIPVREERLGMPNMPDRAYALLGEAHAIVSIARWIDADAIARCRSLEWFQCLITGTDHLNDLLRGRDVVLTNARGIHGQQMSELAVLNMLMHARQVPRLVRNQAAHKWERVGPRVLKDRTVVIVGVGAIATDLAMLCKAFGMTTIGVSRTPRAVEGFDRVEPRDRLREVLGEADYVVALLPMTEENRGAIGREELAAMRPDACLINIARGGVVDEAALVDTLREGRIGGAGLDVFETTPLPPESPLWDMENVFITPHIGGQSDRYDENALPIVAANLKCFVAGRFDQMVNQVAL